MGKTMPFLPPMTGNGKFMPPIKMLMTGGWVIPVYPHYIVLNPHAPPFYGVSSERRTGPWCGMIFGISKMEPH